MLLAVLTCQSATETAQRHWPTWRAHFENIVFVTTVDSNCWVPEGREEWRIGRDYYNDRDAPTDNLPRRTVETLDRFLQTPHDRLVLIEYDVVMFRKPELKRQFSGTIFNLFIHSPWAFDRKCASEFARVGGLLLDAGCITGGWPDQHLRLIYNIVRPSVDASPNYTKNTLDQPWMIAEAREAIQRGAFGVHGVKDSEQFEALTA